jgi:hypothetical protein
MISVIISILLALAFTYLGAYAGTFNKQGATVLHKRFKFIIPLLFLPQALWVFAPVGLNEYFFWFIVFYFNIGYFFLNSLNVFDIEKFKLKSNLSLGTAFMTFMMCTYLFSTTFIFRAEDIGNRMEISRLKDNVDINSFYYEATEGNVRIIPFTTASALASKALSESTSEGVTLGSALELNKDIASIQVINKKTFWVIPLKYTGFTLLKQWRYGGIDAYVLVDAFNQNALPKLIKSGVDTKENFLMNQSHGGSLHRNLVRQFHSTFPTDIVSKFKLVVNDNLKPYLAAYIVNAEVGLANYTPNSVVLYDFESEIFTKYTDDIPRWLEVHVDIDTTISMINDWGKHRKGFWAGLGNTFSTELTDYTEGHGNDMFFVNTSEGYSWFSGMSSSSKSNDSIVDLIFVNTSTGVGTLIKAKGSDENGIINAVQSKLGVDSDKWQALMPIKYLLANELDVWILPIIDRTTKLVQKIAIVDGQNINRVSVGKSLENAISEFMKLGNLEQKLIESKEKVIVTGHIDALNMVGILENVMVYIRLKDNPKIIIECNTSFTNQCLILKVGDTIKFESFIKDNGFTSITKIL